MVVFLSQSESFLFLYELLSLICLVFSGGYIGKAMTVGYEKKDGILWDGYWYTVKFIFKIRFLSITKMGSRGLSSATAYCDSMGCSHIRPMEKVCLCCLL